MTERPEEMWRHLARPRSAGAWVPGSARRQDDGPVVRRRPGYERSLI